MQIGYVYTRKKSLVLALSVPFMGLQQFVLLPAKEKKNPNQPDFSVIHIVGDGEKSSCGGVWNKVSDAGKPYKSLTIENPLFFKGRLHCAIFEMEQQRTVTDDKGEKTLTHTVVWSAPQQQDPSSAFSQQPAYTPQTQQTGAQQETGTQSAPEVVYNNDEEIPF